MIPYAWLFVAAFAGAVAGFATCLVLAAIIRTRPMDGRAYTGTLGEDTSDDEADQFLRDLNQPGDAA